MCSEQIPKRKPKFLRGKDKDEKKPAVQPKKFVAFSFADSRSIEAAYQTKLEELEAERITNRAGSKRPRVVSAEDATMSGINNSGDESEKRDGVKVQVNEDFLFDVNIEERELAPVYWEGPVYEVRRGSWFYQEGSNLRPCEENLAAQLEEGYLKVRPWLYAQRSRSTSRPRTITPRSSLDNLKNIAAVSSDSLSKPTTTTTQHQPQTHRLFGAYMNSVATYQDSSIAWLSSEGVLSWVTSTVYERFAGGGYMSGVKLVRGYTEPNKAREDNPSSTPTGTQSTTTEPDEKLQKALKRRSAPPSTRSESGDADTAKEDATLENTRTRLTRQLSNLIEGVKEPMEEEEAVRQQEEKEISDDYNARLGETQGREIEHLILVTHGIGQLLSLK